VEEEEVGGVGWVDRRRRSWAWRAGRGARGAPTKRVSVLLPLCVSHSVSPTVSPSLCLPQHTPKSERVGVERCIPCPRPPGPISRRGDGSNRTGNVEKTPLPESTLRVRQSTRCARRQLMRRKEV
jgi:hypothetical protein